MKIASKISIGVISAVSSIITVYAVDSRSMLSTDSLVMAGVQCETCSEDGAKSCDVSNSGDGHPGSGNCGNGTAAVKTCVENKGKKKLEDSPHSGEAKDNENVNCPKPTNAYKCDGTNWVADPDATCGQKATCTVEGVVNNDPICADPDGE